MTNPIEQFEKDRKTEVETMIVAVLIAMGVNFLVSGIVDYESGQCEFVRVFCGLIIILTAFILHRYHYAATSRIHHRVNGFFIYDSDKRELVSIPSYDLAIRMFNHMMCASNEIKRIWRGSTLGSILYKNGKLEIEETEAHKIVTELMEYCVIEILSTTLTDYFDGKDEKKLVKLSREDLPDFLDNRFVYWYSQEPENNGELKKYLEIEGCTLEEAFSKWCNSASQSKPYHKFEIVLPQNAKIRRNNNGIIIENSYFALMIKCLFSGTNANMPLGYEEDYLNIHSNQRQFIKAFSISVDINVKYKTRFMFSLRPFHQFAWLDTFFNELNKIISADYYYERIGWSTVETMLKCITIKHEK